MTKPSLPAALLCAGLPERLISDKPVGSSSFPLVTSQRTAPIWYDPNDHKGVVRAIGDLIDDVERVTAHRPRASVSRPTDPMPVIVGTLGKSAVIDELAATSKFDVTDLRGKWESRITCATCAPPMK